MLKRVFSTLLIATLLVGFNNTISYSIHKDNKTTEILDDFQLNSIYENNEEIIDELYFSKQPKTMKDLEKAIQVFEVNNEKPKWEFLVEDDIVPKGYTIKKVESDEGDYYTFFKDLNILYDEAEDDNSAEEKRTNSTKPLSYSNITTATELQNAINDVGDGEIIALSNDIDLEGFELTVTKKITLTSVSSTNPVILTQLDASRHMRVENGGDLTLSNIIIEGRGLPNIEEIDIEDFEIIESGGIEVYGNLIIEKGTIIRHNISNLGGGISLQTGAITMNGGEVSENIALQRGGGVYIESGKFVLNSGEITRNGIDFELLFTLTNNDIGIQPPESGGGIYVMRQGEFIMNGGIISHNKINYGAGICTEGETIINGGAIDGNYALYQGGGVRHESGGLTVGATTGKKVQIVNNSVTDHAKGSDSLQPGDGDGGGIFIAIEVKFTEINGVPVGSVGNIKYDEVTIGENIVFSGNKAWESYIPPSNITIEEYDKEGKILWKTINNFTCTIPFEDNNRLSPLNNYDINVRTIEVKYLNNYEGSEKLFELQSVADHQSTVRPKKDPIREGYDFLGWYKDIDGTIPFDFDKEITEETSVYAKWRISQKFGSVKIIKKDDSENLLENVEFKLQMKNSTDNWIDVETKLTNNFGELFFGKSNGENTLEEGSYRVIETRTSSGDYSLLKDPIEFNMPYEITLDLNEVPEDDSFENIVDNGTTKTYSYYNLTFTVKNSGVIGLPDAGGIDMIKIIYAMGIGLVIISGMIFIINKKVKWGEKNEN